MASRPEAHRAHDGQVPQVRTSRTNGHRSRSGIRPGFQQETAELLERRRKLREETVRELQRSAKERFYKTKRTDPDAVCAPQSGTLGWLKRQGVAHAEQLHQWGVSAPARHIAALLWMCCNEIGETFVSQERLKRLSGWSISRIYAALRELERAVAISQIPVPNHYRPIERAGTVTHLVLPTEEQLGLAFPPLPEQRHREPSRQVPLPGVDDAPTGEPTEAPGDAAAPAFQGAPAEPISPPVNSTGEASPSVTSSLSGDARAQQEALTSARPMLARTRLDGAMDAAPEPDPIESPPRGGADEPTLTWFESETDALECLQADLEHQRRERNIVHEPPPPARSPEHVERAELNRLQRELEAKRRRYDWRNGKHARKRPSTSAEFIGSLVERAPIDPEAVPKPGDAESFERFMGRLKAHGVLDALRSHGVTTADRMPPRSSDPHSGRRAQTGPHPKGCGCARCVSR